MRKLVESAAVARGAHGSLVAHAWLALAAALVLAHLPRTAQAALQLELSGPTTIEQSACAPYDVKQINSDTGQPVVNSTSRVVTLTQNGSGQFYAGSLCGSVITQVTIRRGQSQKRFYFRNPVAQTVQIGATAKRALSASLTINTSGVTPAPSPTPTVTPTPTPTATATPAPSPSPTATSTPMPTPTATATPTPMPSSSPPATSAEIIFNVDWSTGGTGRSTSALTDGGKIEEYGYPADRLLETLGLSSLGRSNWPTNGLRVSFGNRDASLVGTANGWAAPAVGQTIYYRMLTYNGLPNNSGVTFEHGMQSNIGAISHCWQFFSPSNGMSELGFCSLTGGFSNYFARVPANRPLRIEWALTRLEGTGARARLQIRIYDESVSMSVPGWTQRDFYGNWGEGPGNLETVSTDFSVGNESDGFRSYTFGASGSSSSIATGLYVSGFAVCLNDWCGPYRMGE